MNGCLNSCENCLSMIELLHYDGDRGEKQKFGKFGVPVGTRVYRYDIR